MTRAEREAHLEKIRAESEQAAHIGVAVAGKYDALVAAAVTQAKALTRIFAAIKNAADHNDRQLALTDELLSAVNNAILMTGLVGHVIEVGTQEEAFAMATSAGNSIN